MIVMKFGGTSVEDAAALGHVAQIVLRHRERRPLVVVSACAGVTNALIGAARHAAEGKIREAVDTVESLRGRHAGIASGLPGGTPEASAREISAQCDELRSLLEGVAVLRELTPRTVDLCASYGERWSSLLLAGAVRDSGAPAVLVDAREVMITDDTFTHAAPLLDAVEERAAAVLRGPLDSGSVVVTQGFVGRTRDGITTTLGRGGSDYSAAIFGAALGAEEIQIWTDVDGVLSADPSIVPHARLVDRMSFDEAAELAYFGAKVLHPSTILPAIEKEIPVRVLNSRRPEAAGTLITCHPGTSGDRVVKSIAYKKGITVITIRSSRMLMSYGFLARIFDLFARHRKSIDVVATSEVGVSLTVDDPSRLEPIAAELRSFAELRVDQAKAVLCVVGEGLRRTSGIAGIAFNALAEAGVNVELISHGGSEINLTFVIDEAMVPRAVRALHDAFFPAGG